MKFKILRPFGLLFCTGMRNTLRSFIKMYSIEVDVIGPEYIPFAGASVPLSARIFYRLGQ